MPPAGGGSFDFSSFLGVEPGDDARPGDEEEEEEEVPYEPVENFDWDGTRPGDASLAELHHPQVNWLLKEVNELKGAEGRDLRDAREKNEELSKTLQELVRAATTSDRDGNQWRAEYQTQAELNDLIGQDILRMTDQMDRIKGLLSNQDSLLQEHDSLTDMKWRKMLRKLDRDVRTQEAMLRDLELRYVMESKALLKANAERNRLLDQMNALTDEEWDQLIDLEKDKLRDLQEVARRKENPSPKNNILEEYKQRKERAKTAQAEREGTSRGGPPVVDDGEGPGRQGGRFKGRATPRGGTMNLAKGFRENEAIQDPLLKRGVQGSKIVADRKGPDPVAELFSRSQAGGLGGGRGGYMTGGRSAAAHDDNGGPEEDYADYLRSPRRPPLDQSQANPDRNIPDDRRTLDPARGPVRRSAAVRQLPRLDHH